MRPNGDQFSRNSGAIGCDAGISSGEPVARIYLSDADTRGFAQPSVERKLLRQIEYLGANFGQMSRVGAVIESFDNPAANDAHFFFAHAASGERGRAHANAAGLHGRIDIERDGVFIDGDTGLSESFFGLAAEHAFDEDIDQHQVSVGAAGNDAIAFGHEGFGERLGVGDDLFCVVFKFGLKRFFEGDGLARDDVNERAALLAWKHAAIDAGSEILLAEDQSGARAAQGFMRGGGDDVRVRYWRGMHARGNQAGEMSHVDDKKSADFVGNLAHAGKVEGAGISAAAADDHLRLFALGNLLQLVVVDDFCILADTVAGDAIELAGKIQFVAVGEVAAMRQVEAEDSVAGLNDGHVGG